MLVGLRLSSIDQKESTIQQHADPDAPLDLRLFCDRGSILVDNRNPKMSWLMRRKLVFWCCRCRQRLRGLFCGSEDDPLEPRVD